MFRTPFMIFVSAILTATFEYSYADIIAVPADERTIQNGIDAASERDTVLVSPGRYFENIGFFRDMVVASLVLTTGDTSFRDSTIIDGTQHGTVVDMANNSREACLLGFTILNGSGRGRDTLREGGGIYIINSSPVISKCRIINNSARSGGGVKIMMASPLFIDCIVEENRAVYGGGIHCTLDRFELNNPEFIRCIITRNECEVTGAGLYSYNSGPILRECIVNDNRSDTDAGGLAIFNGGARLERCVIAGNFVRGLGAAACICYEGSADFINCTVTGNTHTNANGSSAVYGHEATIRCSNTIFWGNQRVEFLFSPRDWQSSIDISYCDLQRGREGIITNDNCFIQWGWGNIDQDPLFVDAEAGDFHLTEESLCIDAGSPRSSRDPDSTLIDIGSYYYPQPNIALDIDSLVFQPTYIGDSDTLSFSVRNRGDQKRLWCVLDEDIRENVFDILNYDRDTLWVQGRESRIFQMVFRPEEDREYIHSMWIMSNDRDESEIEIPIRAPGLRSVDGSDTDKLLQFRLISVCPNPFNAQIQIQFTLLLPGKMRFVIYNALGQRTDELKEEVWMSAGNHSRSINGLALPAGKYFLVLESFNKQQFIPITLVK